jgi:hypothetical protein
LQTCPNRFQISPNPANTKLQVKASDMKQGDVYKVVSPRGQPLIEGVAESGNFEIDISCLSPGLYFFILQDDKQRQLKRFVKR